MGEIAEWEVPVHCMYGWTSGIQLMGGSNAV